MLNDGKPLQSVVSLLNHKMNVANFSHMLCWKNVTLECRFSASICFLREVDSVSCHQTCLAGLRHNRACLILSHSVIEWGANCNFLWITGRYVSLLFCWLHSLAPRRSNWNCFLLRKCLTPSHKNRANLIKPNYQSGAGKSKGFWRAYIMCHIKLNPVSFASVPYGWSCCR